MEKENEDINSIFIEIRKNIDGEFLYSEKWRKKFYKCLVTY